MSLRELAPASLMQDEKVDESNRPSEESADSRHVTKHRYIQHSHLASPQLTAHVSVKLKKVNNNPTSRFGGML